MSFDQNILLICLIFASLTGLFMRHQLTGLFLRLFPYFLLFSCAVQIFAKEYSRPLPHKSNHWIYNIYSPVECVFYCLLLVEGIQNMRLKKVCIAFITGYCLFTLYNVLFLQGFAVFNTYTYIFEAIIVVCLSLFFLIDFARNENDPPFFREPIFWIASALIITFLGDFMIMGLLNLLIANPGKYTLLSFTVIKYLNIIKCLLFAIAFVCKTSPLLRNKFS